MGARAQQLEWLEPPKDKVHSILLIRGNFVPFEIERIGEWMHEVGLENAIIYLPSGGEVKWVSEEEMNDNGWYRKVEE